MQEFQFKYAVNDTYMAVRYTGDDTCVAVPSSFYGRPVSILYDNLFQNHAEIQEVILPDTLTDIGGFVFDGCTGLKQITLPDHISVLWQYAFVRSSLTSVILPASLKSLYPFVFKDCALLERAYCPAGLKEISAWTFQGCKNLSEITVSRHTVIDERAFDGCGPVRFIYTD